MVRTINWWVTPPIGGEVETDDTDVTGAGAWAVCLVFLILSLSAIMLQQIAAGTY